MRVSHVITRLIVGGAQENTVSTVLGLRRRTPWDLELVSGPSLGREGSLESVFRDLPGVLRTEPHLVRPIHPWHDLLGYRSLIRHFRRTRPVVVHTHSGKAGILGRLAAHKAGIPVVVHSIHGPSFGAFQGAVANAVFTQAERAAGRVTDHFVVVADAMRRQYLAAGIGRDDDYTRIFSGFDLDPYLAATRDPALASRFGISPQDFVVGKVARLFALKGHDDLFAAAPELVRRIPNIRFLLVGDGEWRPRFESLAQRPGLQGRFVFTGLVPPSDVARHVALMDVLVHLSRREGLPRALPQAAAAGVPLVAYDCDGAGEVCQSDRTGFLLPPGDLSALTAALARLTSDPGLRRSLGEAGRGFVRENFSVERMVEEQDRLYRKLLQSKGIPVP
jgi:glycosyltransferase involved in cell wall biosynthesis